MANNELYHFGILGQKWGVRRFQNEDGTLTPEGRERYLGSDYARQAGAMTRANLDVYNQTVDLANPDLSKINKKYDGIDLTDDRNNLQYTKEVRDMWQKHFRDVLAKDLGTDSSKLVGQKWLEEMFGYGDIFDSTIADLERKVKAQESNAQRKTLSQRFDLALKDNPQLTYAKIYKDMKVNLDSDDPDVYKEAEDLWLKKHGY